MQHILDAILAGDTAQEDFANLDLPESYRAVTVHKDEVDMFEGLDDPRQGPAQVAARRRRAAARARPRRGVRRGDGHARSTTTPSGPRSSSRSRPSASSSATAGCRRSPSGTTCPTTSSAPTWPASCSRPAPACTRGSPATEVVAHCLSVELEHPDGHNDTMLDPEQRIWGFETNFGGLAHIALVKANQLMPKPAHLTWEEAASPGLVNCTAYRQLVSKQRRRHEAGRQRPDLGRLRRPRRLRDAVRPQRRRHPGLRGLQRGEGRDLPQDGRGADHQPLRGGLPVLEGRAHPGPARSGSGSARRSAS